MGKALTSASNPGQPGQPWANTGGDQRQNAESLQRGRVKGGGTQKPARPTEPNSCRMRKQPEPSEPSTGREGPCGSGIPSLRIPGHPWFQPGSIPGSQPGTSIPGSRPGPIPGFQPGTSPFPARIPPVRALPQAVSGLAGWVPIQPPCRGSQLSLPADLQPGCRQSHSRPRHFVQQPRAGPGSLSRSPNPRWRLTCSRNISWHFGSINSSGSGESLSPQGGLEPL